MLLDSDRMQFGQTNVDIVSSIERRWLEKDMPKDTHSYSDEDKYETCS